MGLSRLEMETIIIYNKEEPLATVYTADKATMARLDKLTTYKRVKQYKHGGQIVAADYECDKHLVTLRSKRMTRELTDEQRATLSERARSIHAKRKESNTAPKNI